jgi:hypothetical protein
MRFIAEGRTLARTLTAAAIVTLTATPAVAQTVIYAFRVPTWDRKGGQV